jgi:hypothetical protein
MAAWKEINSVACLLVVFKCTPPWPPDGVVAARGRAEFRIMIKEKRKKNGPADA